MTLKRTDLAKGLGLKISDKMKKAGVPDRFASAGVPDRREQRKIDQERGLVPFAIKLNGELAQQLRALAATEQIDLSELVDTLLRAGLKAHR